MAPIDKIETCEGSISATGTARAGRWARSKQQVKPACIDAPAGGDNSAKQEGKAPCRATPTAVDNSNASRHIVYTIGTWRVSREMYLRQFARLGVPLLIDIRGNPRAGRQEDMWRGRDLTHALQAAGIRYEYMGDALGEDQVDMEDEESLRRRLKGLLAASPPGPVCLLGHMHEPHKCHRLRLCEMLPESCMAVHLLWEDHCNVRELSHAEARTRQASAIDYFYAHQAQEANQRRAEQQAALADQSDSGADVPSASSGGRWRGEERRRRRQLCEATKIADASTHQVSLDAQSFAAVAAALPCARWDSMSTTEWEELLRDGKSYRLLLPWDTELLWYPKFLDDDVAEELEANIQDRVTMYHPTYRFQTPSGITEEKIIRKGQAKICDDFSFSVQYSSRADVSNLYEVIRFEPWSQQLLRFVEAASETVFNAIWFNQYKDGTVTIHWHADSDEGLGPNPVIGSVSLGATRDFAFKSKRAWQGGASGAGGIIHLTFPLFHGSLIVMGRNSQTHWLHGVPAMEGLCQPRTNLTFRFYAHEDLALLGKGEVSLEEDAKVDEVLHKDPEMQGASHICLRNSKLVRETRCTAPGDAADGALRDQPHTSQMPSRIRLCPDTACCKSSCNAPRSFLVDVPSSPHTTVGDFRRRLCDAVQPIERLLIPTTSAQADIGTNSHKRATGMDGTPRLLQDAELLSSVLTGVNIEADGLAVLIFQPTVLALDSLEKPHAVAKHSASSPSSSGAWWKPYACECPDSFDMLRREFETSLPQGYSPPSDRSNVVPIKDGGDWVREVIQSLSGIQRKSKGRGQLSRQVFHQTSEFVALYCGCPKSTVHMIIAPKRLLDFSSLGKAEVPIVGRLAAYACLLVEQLSMVFPHLRFAAGMRVRRGRVCQFHIHVLSMDLISQRPEDLSRKHYEDFTAGPACFLPLGMLVNILESSSALPQPKHVLASMNGISCHRCGHFFGDAMLQLVEHLKCCDRWQAKNAPSDISKTAATKDSGNIARGAQIDQDAVRQVEEVTLKEVALLEEMGFGGYGHEALRAALVAEGSVERAIEVFAAA